MTSTSLSSAVKAIPAFALKPPTSGDRPKPPTRTNRAFTGKPAAKPKAFKPQAEAEAQQEPTAAGPIVARNVKLDTWLKEIGDKPGYTEAREYLLAGPPYKGESDFAAKEQLKDNGAKWIPNPHKEKGVKDGITPGWWSALKERDVRTFMALTYTRESRYSKAPRECKSWQPLGVPEESAQNVLKLLAQFDAHVEDFERRQAKERAAVPSKTQAAEQAMLMNVSKSAADEPIDYRKHKITGPCSGCFMFGKGPRMISMPNVGEWERLTEELKQRDLANIKLLSERFVIGAARITFCTSCALEVYEQFLDCGCGQTWDQCPTCRALRCEKQPCACGEEEEAVAWERAQNTTHRIHDDRMRAAAALVLSGGDVGGGGLRDMDVDDADNAPEDNGPLWSDHQEYD